MIRDTGADRGIEMRAEDLLARAGLPDAAVVDAKPDGALHLIWFQGRARLALWVRAGDGTTWEITESGRRVAQGKIRYSMEPQGRFRFGSTDPRPRDVQRLRQAIHLYELR